MSIRFSVAIPAYNSANFIGETLEAILAQSYPPAEVIVVDDGSTDNTREIVERFGTRVSYQSITNSGSGFARKVAVEKCTSEWIATCDSDDVWIPTHLERRANLIEQFPTATFTFSDCTAVGPNAITHYSRLAEAPPGWLTQWTDQRNGDFVLFLDAYRAFLRFNPAFVSGWAFRTDVYRKMGGINPRYSRVRAEDTDFMRRFLLHPMAIVAGDLHPTWAYRRHANNKSSNQWQSVLGKANILSDHLQDNLVPERLRKEVVEEITATRISACNMAFWESNYQGSLEIFRTIPLHHRSPKMHIRALLSTIRMRRRWL